MRDLDLLRTLPCGTSPAICSRSDCQPATRIAPPPPTHTHAERQADRQAGRQARRQMTQIKTQTQTSTHAHAHRPVALDQLARPRLPLYVHACLCASMHVREGDWREREGGVISPDFSLELTGFFPGKHFIHFLVLKMMDFRNFVLQTAFRS